MLWGLWCEFLLVLPAQLRKQFQQLAQTRVRCLTTLTRALLVQRNAGSPTEQESQLHHERKETKSLDSISSSQRAGEGERGGGKNSNCSGLNLF